MSYIANLVACDIPRYIPSFSFCKAKPNKVLYNIKCMLYKTYLPDVEYPCHHGAEVKHLLAGSGSQQH